MEENLREVAVAVTYNPEEDSFLLLKRSDDRDRFPGKWEFPSGFMDDAEEVKNAALRELEEETGLKGTVIRTGEFFEVETDDYMFLVHPVLITVDTMKVKMSKEHQDFRWVGLDEIKSLDTVPNIERDLKRVGIHG